MVAMKLRDMEHKEKPDRLQTAPLIKTRNKLNEVEYLHIRIGVTPIVHINGHTRTTIAHDCTVVAKSPSLVTLPISPP